MNKVILILFILLSGTTLKLKAQTHVLDTVCNIKQVTNSAKKSPWETVKQDEGITIKYRWLKINKSTKTREMLAQFSVVTPKDSIFNFLQQPEKHVEWNKGVKSFKVLKNDSLSWVSHSIYNIPFPISQQDLVAKNIRIDSNHQTTINITSQPNFIPPLEDIDRVKYYIGQWIIKPISETSDTVNVSFSAITLSKSYIPRFIKDPIVQNNLLKSFKALKRELENVKTF